jgi:hypothetical protein
MKIILLYVIIQKPGFEPVTTLGAAYIRRPRQQTRADKHVMSSATKRVNASELCLDPPLVNKITRPRGTLKQPLRKAKHSQTAVYMYITDKSQNVSRHDTVGKMAMKLNVFVKMG